MEIVAESRAGRKRNFERRNSQTCRKGWKPRHGTLRQLAKDIAESIQQHEGRAPENYTGDADLLKMIREELGF